MIDSASNPIQSSTHLSSEMPLMLWSRNAHLSLLIAIFVLHFIEVNCNPGCKFVSPLCQKNIIPALFTGRTIEMQSNERTSLKKNSRTEVYFLRQNIFLPLTIIQIMFSYFFCLSKEFVYQRRERKTSASLENEVFLYLCTL